jgi:hypothetical protein
MPGVEYLQAGGGDTDDQVGPEVCLVFTAGTEPAGRPVRG